MASIGAFAAKTAPVTQADGAVLPFADALYTGLVLGKIGTTVFDVLNLVPKVHLRNVDSEAPASKNLGMR